MKAVINDAIRQKLIKYIMDTKDNIYLVYSNVSGTIQTSDDTIKRNDASSLGSATYAIKLDTAELVYAVKSSYISGAETKTINGIVYTVSATITDNATSNNSYNALYSIVNTGTTAHGNYNIVSVVLNVDSTADEITSFGSTIFDNSTIIAQARLSSPEAIPNGSVPVLIQF